MSKRRETFNIILGFSVIIVSLSLIMGGTAQADFSGTGNEHLSRNLYQTSTTPYDPIYIISDSNFSATAADKGWAGSGTSGSPYIIENYLIDLSGASGNCIQISGTTAYFTIQNCILTGASSGSGIYLANVANGKMTNNTSNNNRYGIYLTDSTNNVIDNNTCSYNGVPGLGIGIDIIRSIGTKIWNNTCNYNYLDGIRLEDHSHYTDIINNECVGNLWRGIMDAYFSDNITIINNICNSNQWGMLYGTSENGLIYNNTFASNTQHGLELDYNCFNNTFQWNSFINNGVNVYDDRLGGIANYYSKNYYSDYKGPDSNQDGIGDVPHAIPSRLGNSDLSPLMVPLGSGPVWVEAPVDQMLGSEQVLNYDLNATAFPPGIDKWWINDTTNFAISSLGLLTNTTTLPDGTYGIQVWVNDTNNNIITAIFSVTFDTTPPTWDQVPSTIFFEFEQSGSYDLNASDINEVSTYWLNDTTYLSIDNQGIIRNSTYLALGSYYVDVSVNDSVGNTLTTPITIVVQDTSGPSWIEPPSDQVFEMSDSFSYKLNATDPSGLDSWWLNTTTYFDIDGVGLVTSIGFTPPGNYPLRVYVNDTWGNILTAEFTVIVNDETPPVWDQIPQDQILTPLDPLHYDLNASDYSGLHMWWLNDTPRFTVDSMGVITNGTYIPDGQYAIKVFVNDTHGNILTGVFLVTVDSIAPYIHGPVQIYSDNDFLIQGWPGSGTDLDPYRIENLDISISGGYCIDIRNTRANFTIQNCILTSSSVGMFFSNVSNGYIFNNTCISNVNYGIFMRQSFNNTIIANNCSGSVYGIYLLAAYTNDVLSNRCPSNDVGIRIEDSHDNRISYNVIENGGSEAIYLLFSSYSNRIENNTCTGYIWGIVLMDTGCYDNIIYNNTCTGGQHGILLSWAGSNFIIGNNCTDNQYGIEIQGSSGTYNIVDNNLFSGNSNYGIYISLSAHHNNVTNNICSGNSRGIEAYGASWISIINNTCSDNSIGIYLESSSNNIVINNTVSNCGTGFHIWKSNGNLFDVIIATDCTSYGIYLRQVTASNLTRALCINSNYGIFVYADSNSNRIANSTFINDVYGIYILASQGNIIRNNTCTSGVYGILLENLYFYGNPSYYGENQLLFNTIENFTYGLYLNLAGGQVIVNNTLVHAGMYLDGNKIGDVRQNTVANNTVNGAPLLFLQDQIGGFYTGIAGQVILANCTEVTIENSVLNNCTVGISLLYSTENLIRGNICNESLVGILLFNSVNNTLSENVCSNNSMSGIHLYKSTDNTLNENICSDNSMSGILLEVSNYNTVANSSCVGNGEDGIQLFGSQWNTIDMNECNFNNQTGIALYGSHYTNITNNRCSFNLDGIWAYYNLNVTIVNNTCNGNEWGIYILIGLSHIIKNNTCQENVYGLSIETPYYGECIVTNNTFVSNDYGLFLNTSSILSTVIWNNFIGNIVDAVDNGTDNLFDYNYWSSYSGSDGDLDWIGDTIYLVAGTAQNNDTHPIMYPRYPFYFTTISTILHIEQGQIFTFTFQTNPIAPVNSWKINATGNFAIDSLGVLSNTTSLGPGQYVISVNVTSIYGITLTCEFILVVEPAAAPSWLETPVTQYVEFTTMMRYDLNASDLSGLGYWWLNDTIHFAIDQQGVITNATSLSVGTYGIMVWVNDTLGNIQSETFQVIVEDTTSPSWIETPEDQLVEYGRILFYNLNATDPSGINSWWVDDEVRFTVDWLGQVRTIDILEVGTYGLTVYVDDNYGNTRYVHLVIEIQDTTSPEWTMIIMDQTIDYGETFDYQLNASDLSSISSWIINNTEFFAISSTGYLTSIGLLEIGDYPLLVTVYDPYDNEISAEFTVSVVSTSTTTPPASTPTTSTGPTTPTTPADNAGLIMAIIIIAGVGSAVIVLVIIFVLRKRRGS